MVVGGFFCRDAAGWSVHEPIHLYCRVPLVSVGNQHCCSLPGVLRNTTHSETQEPPQSSLQ